MSPTHDRPLKICVDDDCVLFLDVGPVRTFSLELFADDEPLTNGRFSEDTGPGRARLSIRSRSL